MKIFKTSLLAAFTALSLVAASGATAGVIFTPGNHPQADEENIIFNGPNTIEGPAMTVTGLTDHSDVLVAFTSPINLITPSNGQAGVTGAGTDSFTDLSVYLLAGGTFGDLIFNLHLAEGNEGTATITAFLEGGGTASYALAVGNGDNFLTIVADDGDRLTKVSISSNVGLDDGRQFRISDIQGAHPVPVPSAFWLLITGLMMMVVLRGRRRLSYPLSLTA
ncbi:VPLPA-CTERM sorting domain-containing protein [Govanella unica]|uniref:VPLPA-CTERM sorting domain-containing protein n=1 Tax=Govanella unica TaxID=2975056 RepID=A0A9X3TWQ1_9PROT|nr:VPLPA-CTERM sorting domain-containing protein [Govania unica]MDA5193124.1 VPLPA-CTERM sorting domain-containing protein [Govania unica]